MRLPLRAAVLARSPTDRPYAPHELQPNELVTRRRGQRGHRADRLHRHAMGTGVRRG
jgi:hypothetical protein